MNDGLLIKQAPFIEDFLPEVNKPTEQTTSASFPVSSPMDSVRALFKAGGYILDPLKHDFKKVITIHMIAFKFLKTLILRCNMKSSSKSFGNVLKKWKSEAEEVTAFAFFSTTDCDLSQGQLDCEVAIRSVNNLVHNLCSSKQASPHTKKLVEQAPPEAEAASS